MVGAQSPTERPGGSRGRRSAKGYVLMNDDIIGLFLSETPFDSLSSSEADADKFGRFVDHQDPVIDPSVIGCGIHGIVVLAVIKGVQYALKVFRKWEQPGPVFFRYDQAIYTSPLANESRAFARLASHNQNGTWAVRCFGWMKLSDAQFKAIGDVVDAYGMSSYELSLQDLSSHDLSRWVIVKEYLPNPTKVAHFREMRENLKIPEELKIYPQDLRLENYRASKVVDLSSTLTGPCPGWSNFEFELFYSKLVPRAFREDQKRS